MRSETCARTPNVSIRVGYEVLGKAQRCEARRSRTLRTDVCHVPEPHGPAEPRRSSRGPPRSLWRDRQAPQRGPAVARRGAAAERVPAGPSSALAPRRRPRAAPCAARSPPEGTAAAPWPPRRRRGPAPRYPRARRAATSTGCAPSSPEVGAGFPQRDAPAGSARRRARPAGRLGQGRFCVRVPLRSSRGNVTSGSMGFLKIIAIFASDVLNFLQAGGSRAFWNRWGRRSCRLCVQRPRPAVVTPGQPAYRCPESWRLSGCGGAKEAKPTPKHAASPCSRSTSRSPRGVLFQCLVMWQGGMRFISGFLSVPLIAAAFAFSPEPQGNVCGRSVPLWGAALPAHSSGWHRGSRRCSWAALSGTCRRYMSGRPSAVWSCRSRLGWFSVEFEELCSILLIGAFCS